MPEAVRLGLCETTSNCGTGSGLPVGADHTTQRKQGKCFHTADECGDEADHHENRTRLGRTTVQPSCREDPYAPPSGLSHRGPSCVRRSFRARLSSQSPQAPRGGFVISTKQSGWRDSNPRPLRPERRRPASMASHGSSRLLVKAIAVRRNSSNNPESPAMPIRRKNVPGCVPSCYRSPGSDVGALVSDASAVAYSHPSSFQSLVQM